MSKWPINLQQLTQVSIVDQGSLVKVDIYFLRS